MSGVHPDMAKVVKRAIELTAIDFTVLYGLRTVEEQRELYARGRTKPGAIVTWTMNSAHLRGHAVDLGVIIGHDYINGDTQEELQFYNQVANAMLQAAAELDIPIVWGGVWKSNPDSGHFELNKAFYKGNKRNV